MALTGSLMRRPRSGKFDTVVEHDRLFLWCRLHRDARWQCVGGLADHFVAAGKWRYQVRLVRAATELGDRFGRAHTVGVY